MDNPYTLDNEWAGYSIGDPYVLKHRGVFYLYCSTKDSETGVKTWSSTDLVDWRYEGLCSTDPVTKGAYAPEVFYWNGTFYMYTSPAGNGHYVLSAPSPTGPFEPVTGNLGKSIDGSVFIEDDGSWYFYHASPAGIIGCPMPDPTSIGAGVNTGAVMNNRWTEGPCVFKRNNRYYMIYTGNHVISKGYRIDYATNTQGPISTYEPAESQNPILLDALGLHTGLGHGSVFIGPDLDSYFLTYHNLVSGIGPFRRLNFDRIVWNDEQLVVLGPTDYAQENPALPDACDYFPGESPGNHWLFPAGGNWVISEPGVIRQDLMVHENEEVMLAVLDSVSENNYTAEFNFRETARENEFSALGALFSYQDASNYGLAMINSYSNQLIITFKENNTWGVPQYAALPEQLQFDHWHTLRLEKFMDTLRFYIDGMKQLSVTKATGGGKIGYATQYAAGEFGFIAFSNHVNGSGTFDVHKPVPGKIPAIQYNQGGEGQGFHKESGNENIFFQVRSDEVELTGSELGGLALASVGANDWFSYNVNVESSGTYNVRVIYRSGSDAARVRFFMDDSDVSGEIELPSTGGSWKPFLVKDIDIGKGFHTLKVQVDNGTIDLYAFEFVASDNAPFSNIFTFDGAFGAGWKYDDGEWRIIDGHATIDGFGKRTHGSEAWRDYTVDTDIRFTRSMNAGLIFRVKNPALGGAGNDPALGTDFLQGYFCGFNFGSIVLGKHNYGWESLTTASVSTEMNTWYHLRVVVNDDRIRVFVDDMTTPIIDYTDTFPFINGMAGMRSFNTGVLFDNFRVTSELLTTSARSGSQVASEENFSIYPNPAHNKIHLSFSNEAVRKVSIRDMNGRLQFTMMALGQEQEYDLHGLSPGIYVLQVEQKDRNITRKIILQ
ncbi:MAG: family 43 glycosylhydrolase [Bacteroidales bacterium]|nr:family 43 glycosylhydrolase [Bacteroidales bacterium]